MLARPSNVVLGVPRSVFQVLSASSLINDTRTRWIFIFRCSVFGHEQIEKNASTRHLPDGRFGY